MPPKSRPLSDQEARNLELARLLARVCDDRRADDVLLLDLRPLCNFTDFFVIATATSSPQMRGIAIESEKVLKEQDAKLLARTGIEEGTWVVLDYGDVILHLLDPAHRAYYQLEELWGDARRLEWAKGS